MDDTDYDKFWAVCDRVARLLAECYPDSLGERTGVLVTLLARFIAVAEANGLITVSGKELLARSTELAEDLYRDLTGRLEDNFPGVQH